MNSNIYNISGEYLKFYFTKNKNLPDLFKNNGAIIVLYNEKNDIKNYERESNMANVYKNTFSLFIHGQQISEGLGFSPQYNQYLYHLQTIMHGDIDKFNDSQTNEYNKLYNDDEVLFPELDKYFYFFNNLYSLPNSIVYILRYLTKNKISIDGDISETYINFEHDGKNYKLDTKNINQFIDNKLLKPLIFYKVIYKVHVQYYDEYEILGGHDDIVLELKYGDIITLDDLYIELRKPAKIQRVEIYLYSLIALNENQDDYNVVDYEITYHQRDGEVNKQPNQMIFEDIFGRNELNIDIIKVSDIDVINNDLTASNINQGHNLYELISDKLQEPLAYFINGHNIEDYNLDYKILKQKIVINNDTDENFGFSVLYDGINTYQQVHVPLISNITFNYLWNNYNYTNIRLSPLFIKFKEDNAIFINKQSDLKGIEFFNTKYTYLTSKQSTKNNGNNKSILIFGLKEDLILNKVFISNVWQGTDGSNKRVISDKMNITNITSLYNLKIKVFNNTYNLYIVDFSKSKYPQYLYINNNNLNENIQAFNIELCYEKNADLTTIYTFSTEVKTYDFEKTNNAEALALYHKIIINENTEDIESIPLQNLIHDDMLWLNFDNTYDNDPGNYFDNVKSTLQKIIQ